MKAMITGASSGIGEAIAVTLHKLGYELLITGRREQRLNDLAHRLGDERIEVRVPRHHRFGGGKGGRRRGWCS